MPEVVGGVTSQHANLQVNRQDGRQHRDLVSKKTPNLLFENMMGFTQTPKLSLKTSYDSKLVKNCLIYHCRKNQSRLSLQSLMCDLIANHPIPSAKSQKITQDLSMYMASCFLLVQTPELPASIQTGQITEWQNHKCRRVCIIQTFFF